jgi:hypothetical protein
LSFYSIQIQDPFQFTNLVLQMLDALEERTRALSR